MNDASVIVGPALIRSDAWRITGAGGHRLRSSGADAVPVAPAASVTATVRLGRVEQFASTVRETLALLVLAVPTGDVPRLRLHVQGAVAAVPGLTTTDTRTWFVGAS